MARDRIGNREIEIDVPPGQPSVSVLEARARFMQVVRRLAPKVLEDLFCPFNRDAFDKKWLRANLVRVQNWSLLHLDKHDLWKEAVPFPCIEGVDPRSTPLMAFFCLINQSRSRIGQARRRHKAKLRKIYRNPQTYDMAGFEEVFPGITALRGEKKSAQFVGSLEAWGKAYGLDADWSLDFALAALGAFIVNHLERQRFGWQMERQDFDFLNYEWTVDLWKFYAWSDAVSKLTDEGTRTLLKGARSIRGSSFRYSWLWKPGTRRAKSEFEVEEFFSVLSSTKEEFEIRAEESFWLGFLNRFRERPNDLVGRSQEVTRIIGDFRAELASYVRKRLALSKGRALRTLGKADWERDLTMTVQMQVLALPLQRVAKTYRLTEDAVRVCVNETMSLLGLKPKRRKRKGRPPGIKEYGWRRRIQK